jgi:hypothetical protein
VEISNTNLGNVPIEKEMEEAKLTFQRCKGEMLRQKILNDEENSLEARERDGESNLEENFV